MRVTVCIMAKPTAVAATPTLCRRLSRPFDIDPAGTDRAQPSSLPHHHRRRGDPRDRGRRRGRGRRKAGHSAHRTAGTGVPRHDPGRKGAALAALGDCAVCHTAEHGRPYAGGRGVPTPFGTVYATNITSDSDTGIGSWSFDASCRALRGGIDRTGRHLYPACCPIRFTRATDDDIAAMYAVLMIRTLLRQATRWNALAFPFNWRPLLGAGTCCSCTRAHGGLLRARTRNGTAGPICSKRLANAVHATRGNIQAC